MDDDRVGMLCVVLELRCDGYVSQEKNIGLYLHFIIIKLNYVP